MGLYSSTATISANGNVALPQPNADMARSRDFFWLFVTGTLDGGTIEIQAANRDDADLGTAAHWSSIGGGTLASLGLGAYQIHDDRMKYRAVLSGATSPSVVLTVR